MKRNILMGLALLTFLVSVPGFAEPFNDLVYVWLNKDSSDPVGHQFPVTNTEDYPFLQSAIAQSGPQRRVHIVYMDLHRLAEHQSIVTEGYEKMGRFIDDHHLNMKLYNFRDICLHQEFLPLIESFQNFGDSVDTVKNYIAAHLEILGLNKAVILDFDVELPDPLVLDMGEFSVLPLLEKNGRYIVDFSGCMDHFVENGLLIVKGAHHQMFDRILSRTINAPSDYFEHHEHDGVYRLFVAEFLRSLYPGGSQHLSDHELFRTYRRLDDLPSPLNGLSTSHLGIKYDRGGSWMKSAREQQPLMVSGHPGNYPVYSRDLQSVEEKILFSRDLSLQKRIEFLAEKGFDFNRRFIWINGLQRKGTIFEAWVDRYDSTDDSEPLTASIQCMFRNGLTLDSIQDERRIRDFPEAAIDVLRANGFQLSDGPVAKNLFQY